MHYLKDLVGKTVLDGARKEIAVADGLNITLIDYRVYLRLKGETLEQIRGRTEEFILLNEVDEIGTEITLYKELKKLKKTIKETDIDTKESYRLNRLIGMDVISFDDIKIGTVKDIVLSEEGRKPFYTVEGPRIEKIRGKREEVLPLIEADHIQDSIKIDLAYDTLARKIREGLRRGPW
ncbi:PRC-barrel domain-containing protein [Candidatus Altiarchaeota archaeon]